MFQVVNWFFGIQEFVTLVCIQRAKYLLASLLRRVFNGAIAMEDIFSFPDLDMETMKLQTHIGADGILQIEAPTDLKDISVNETADKHR